MTIFPNYMTWLTFLLLTSMAPVNYFPSGSLTIPGKRLELPVREKTIIFNVAIRDLDEFKKFVRIASKLKPYARVQVNVSTLADKSFYEVPRQRSPWFEYACYNATPYKFFPHPKIAPFIPADFVNRNRQLLLAKAGILRDNGMEAAFFGSEPDFLPEAFFDAYPELMGPRVDHPRRSNGKAFAPCVSQKEVQVIYSSMMAELLKNAPGIKTFYFKTNDAGAGFCWSNWLYSGPNGPGHCKNETTGEKVRMLMNALQSGAAKAGARLDIYLAAPQGTSNFSNEERNDIQNHLPANCFFNSTAEHEIIRIGSSIDALYPVKGIADLISFNNNLQSIKDQKDQTVIVNFRSFYDRGNEDLGAEEILINLLIKKLQATGADIVQEACEEIAGKKYATDLYNGFLALHDAFKFKETYLGNLYGINWNVGARMISRPLVIAPKRLSKEEENYFLPYVFNVSEEEARSDYTDIQGGRWKTIPDSVVSYVEKIKKINGQLALIADGATGQDFIRQMITALRIHASLIKSCGNFYAAQGIIDNNKDRINGPVHRPDKESSWTGDADLQKFNLIMRDELDNTAELRAVLQNGGIHSLCLAKDRLHEDCFLLGPEIMEQLKKKRKIMLDHWLDIQDYLTTPFK